MAFQAAGFEDAAGRQLVIRILEDAAVGPLVRGLRGFALRLQVGHDRLDLLGRPGRQPELDLRDDLPRLQVGPAITEAQLHPRLPPRTRGVDDERTLEDPGPVATVRARVHPHSATGGSGDRAGELEPAEARSPSPVEADRVGRATA